jgi:hypothetical protein
MASAAINLASAFARLVCLSFVVLAGLTIPEAWKMNDSERVLEGSTLYVPLAVCSPNSIETDGLAIILGDDSDKKCHTLDSFINAYVASLIFAIAGTVFFIAFDILERSHNGMVSRGSVLGMGFFLTFIILQAAAGCWAMLEETTYWTDYYNEALKNMNSTVAVSNVEMLGNTDYIMYTFYVALASAGLILFSTVLDVCCGGGNRQAKPVKETKHQQPPKQKSSTASTIVPPPEFPDVLKEDEKLDDNSMQEAPVQEGERPSWSNV